MTAPAPSSQLEQIRKEIEAVSEAADRLAASVAPELAVRKPAPGVWSVAECLAHLNLTAQAFLPKLREAIAQGRRDSLLGSGPFRPDFFGRLLIWMLEPPYRMKVKTPPAFDPAVQSAVPLDKVMTEFRALQAQILECVKDCEGLALDRLKVVSPFAQNLKYSVYSTLRVIPSHARRHLWQAERIREALSRPAS
jgi:hypothetical protein